MVPLSLPVSTPRLRLRPYQDSDAEALLPMYARDDVSRYLPGEPWKAEVARTEVADRREQTGVETESRRLALVVETQRDASANGRSSAPRAVGVISLWIDGSDETKAEVGWVFHPDHGGRGYATEAAQEILRIAFDHYGLRRVIAQMDARNTASAKLGERIGMTREAHFRQDFWSKGEWTDTLVYAILADDRR